MRQLSSAVHSLYSTSRLVWACFHVARVERESGGEGGHRISQGFSSELAYWHFHCILMTKETLKTSPDSRGGKTEFHLFTREAANHIVEGVDIWILKKWGRFHSQSTTFSFSNVSPTRGKASVSTCHAPHTALTTPLHSIHNS